MPTVEQLQRLLRNRIAPDEVLASIGDKPIVNSFERRFKHVVDSVNLIPMSGKERWFRQFKKGDHVIYWKSSESNVGVDVIGVVWDEKGNSQVFCGTILPP